MNAADILRAAIKELDADTIVAWIPALPVDSRIWLAAAPGVDRKVLLALSTDSSLRVRTTLLSNHPMPTPVLDSMLAQSDEAYLLAAAAKNAGLSKEQFERIARDERPAVRLGILEGRSRHLVTHPDILAGLLEWARTAKLSEGAKEAIPTLLARMNRNFLASFGAEKIAQMAASGQVDPAQLVAVVYDWAELWEALVEALPGNEDLARMAASLLVDERGQAISPQLRETIDSWGHGYQLAEKQAEPPETVWAKDLPRELATLDYSDACSNVEEYVKVKTQEEIANDLLDAVVALEGKHAFDLFDYFEALGPGFERFGHEDFSLTLIDAFQKRGLTKDSVDARYLVRTCASYAGHSERVCSRLATMVAGMTEIQTQTARVLTRTQWAKTHPQDVPLPVLRAASDLANPGWAWILKTCAAKGMDQASLEAVQRWMGTFTGTPAELVDVVADNKLDKAHLVTLNTKASKARGRKI